MLRQTMNSMTVYISCPPDIQSTKISKTEIFQVKHTNEINGHHFKSNIAKSVEIEKSNVIDDKPAVFS